MGMIKWSQKSRPNKIPRASSKSQKLPGPNFNPRKIPCPGLLSNSKTCLFVLYLQNYAARALPILFKTPTQIKLPKKYMPNFRTQKNPGIKNFKPQKILRSSTSLKISSIPLGEVWIFSGTRHCTKTRRLNIL